MGVMQASANCADYFDSDSTYHVIDYGLGQLSEYENHWVAANKTYTITDMNGKFMQAGRCACTDNSDGSMKTVCTAEGPGVPKGSIGSMRSYDLPKSAGAVYSCYNFGTRADVPDTCDGAPNFNLAKKIA